MWQTSDARVDWVQSKHIYLNEDRIATKYNSEGNENTSAEKERTYYYHSDHLGSAQVVTNWRGQIHERLEYTPYGELWIDWKGGTALEDTTPFRFTGKEMDAETGFYYHGARYLDPKTSRWISADPALGDYVPTPGQKAGKLPGIGGVFNNVNLHVYHYAGNNPVKYTDPDGNETITSETTKENYDSITRGEPEFFSEKNWNEAQNYFAENPNGAYCRASDELHWQQFEDKNDIDYINPDEANVKLFSAIMTAKTVLSVGKALVGGLTKSPAQLQQIANKSLSSGAKEKQLLNIGGKIRLEKGVESVFSPVQKELGVKVAGAIEKPWHLVIFGKELPLNPFNPLWKFFPK
jgi:RHS repeat-associated protein